MWWSKKKPSEVVCQDGARLPEKDPNDNTLTGSSKVWEKEDYCPQCFSTTSHEECMADICNSCGYFGSIGARLIQYTRVRREIWYEGSWRYQYKYNNKPDGWTIEGKRL